MRIFAAIYPPAQVLASALGLLDAMRGPEGSRSPLIWTSPDLLHVTTAFYGDVPDGAEDDLVSHLDVLSRQSASMPLHLRGGGVFHDRTLWLGVGGAVEALHRLSAGCASAGEEVGLRLDRRPRRRAHLTVARARSTDRAVRRPRRGGRPASSSAGAALEQYAAALAVFAGPTWTARELCLVESDLTAARATYTVLERFALRG